MGVGARVWAGLLVGLMVPRAAVALPEVWAINGSNATIQQIDFDGTMLGSLDFGGPAFTDLHVVGSEVWAANSLGIQRVAFDGTFLGTHFVGSFVDLRVVPEPSTALLLAFGVVAMAVGRRRGAL